MWGQVLALFCFGVRAGFGSWMKTLLFVNVVGKWNTRKRKTRLQSVFPDSLNWRQVTRHPCCPSRKFVCLESAFTKENVRGQGKNQVFYKGGDKIAYDYFPGELPTVLFLPGLSMNRHSAKGNALEVACKLQKRAYLSADYYGIGRSSGDIRDGTVSRWTEDTVDLIDQLIPQGPVVLVGAGVGGWVALHVTLRRPERVAGIVGVAPDPDFTQDVLWPKLSDEVKSIIMKEGLYELPWGYRTYPISRNLIEDGKKMCLLQGSSGSIAIDCPVRIIHGLDDEEIPPQRALRLADRLRSQDVVISFVKSGGHTLETEEDFQRMISSVVELCKKSFTYDLSSPQSG